MRTIDRNVDNGEAKTSDNVALVHQLLRRIIDWDADAIKVGSVAGVGGSSVKEFTASSTGADLSETSNVGADHQISTIMFHRDNSESIDIRIGIEDSNGDQFEIFSETSTSTQNVVVTDEILMSSNLEVFVETTGVTTGDVEFRTAYEEV